MLDELSTSAGRATSVHRSKLQTSLAFTPLAEDSGFPCDTEVGPVDEAVLTGGKAADDKAA